MEAGRKRTVGTAHPRRPQRLARPHWEEAVSRAARAATPGRVGRAVTFQSGKGQTATGLLSLMEISTHCFLKCLRSLTPGHCIAKGQCNAGILFLVLKQQHPVSFVIICNKITRTTYLTIYNYITIKILFYTFKKKSACVMSSIQQNIIIVICVSTWAVFYVFDRSLLCSPRLHLFDQKTTLFYLFYFKM